MRTDIFQTLTMSEARAWCEDVDSLGDEAFSKLELDWTNYEIGEVSETLLPLRKAIVAQFEASKKEHGFGRNKYQIDLSVGLLLYQKLNELGFTMADASNDDVWRFLTIRVFPDITYLRWPKSDKEGSDNQGRINRKRFFRHTRRIWLKTLWWYVHLSWQGSPEKTYRVLRDFGSDTISQFIERTGNAYRVDVYRALIRALSNEPTLKESDLTSLMKLNLSQCCVIEPVLAKGGVDGYCAELVGNYMEKNYAC